MTIFTLSYGNNYFILLKCQSTKIWQWWPWAERQPLGLITELKTLTLHFYGGWEWNIWSKVLNWFNYYLSMRQHCTRRLWACPGACLGSVWQCSEFTEDWGQDWRWMAAGATSGHSGLCCQEPSLAISGNLATAKRGELANHCMGLINNRYTESAILMD